MPLNVDANVERTCLVFLCFSLLLVELVQGNGTRFNKTRVRLRMSRQFQSSASSK